MMHEYRCRILKVVDGDTVDVDIDLGFDIWMKNERIRLLGIDTPESRTRDKEEKKFGLLAKKIVETFMPVGSKQTLVTKKDGTGKFGRVLGKFIVYDAKNDCYTHLNDYMVREAYAVKYTGQSKSDVAEQHLKNRQIIMERGEIDASE